jgi:putative endopeptidase
MMNMFRSVTLSFCVCVLFGAQSTSRSGIDTSSFDTSCKPCDDFWRYANGGWLDKNPIPARQASWGTMSVMAEGNRERLRAILEAAMQNASAAAGSNERKIGDYYASCLDTATIDARGLKPLQGELDKVAAIKSAKEVAAALNDFQTLGGGMGGGRGGGGSSVGPFIIMGGPDLKNSNDIIANAAPSGLSLPERDYYFKSDDRSVKIRDEFLKHVAKVMALAGDSPEAAAKAAKTVLSFETSLAEATMSNVNRRDPYARYHKMDLAGLSRLSPASDWKALFHELHIPAGTAVNVTEPDFFKRYNQLLATTPVEDWKTWIRWRLLGGASAFLSKPFSDEAFYFSSTVLTGVKEQLPRWQTCVNAVDGSLGDALGAVFVQKHFPPAAKKRMSELVENLRATLRRQLESADWLQPETRKNAVAKLNAFVAKIGYPDRWRDYSQLHVGRKTFYENVRAAGANSRAYQIAKIGKPVDRNDWGMTPPTVNAYYNPPLNEIAFPAGILQPPMFDMSADDAVNYGAIGAVIGHEMGHGFDDQGSKFDAQGNLKNWWTEEDRKKFDQRAGCVVDEFNTLEVGEGLHHTGKLVVGEAMGDLGGLTLAYKAYHRSLNGAPGPVIDGFTADQRFFLAFARVWGTQMRPEAMRLRLNTDPHPLSKFRANGTLQNMPEFQKAFGCKAGDPMVRPAEKQCRLW